jgi:pyridoxine/pyridoxamine 5'-phosphate oxidase
MRHFLLFLFLGLTALSATAQQNLGRITGNIQSNGNFFIRDSAIGAANTPQYDYQKFGAETWLTLNYSHNGLDAGLRFDMFNNSNLLNPTSSYTDEGIGRWYARKQVGKFDFAGGYLYDQVGSGIIYRAYEERALMIDNALYGARLGYNFNENWKIRAFAGRQKQQFDRYATTIRGGALEGFIKPDSTKNFSFAPGLGIVARTYDKAIADEIANTIAGYLPVDSTGAQYNTYAATFFNTLSAGNFSWYVEAAGKTNDVIFDPLALRTIIERDEDGRERIDTIAGKIVNRRGYTFYTSLSYSRKGLGITLEAKRTKDFSLRQNPSAIGIQGPINFLPPMAKQNTYRLTARFAPATQELGEQAVQADIRYKLNKKLSFGINFSDIQFLDGTELYREIAPEFTWKQKRKWQLIAGLQVLKYNIEVYQGKKGYVDALTPYAELLYKFSGRKSLRIEAQYLATEEEFGSWANAVVEVGLAPHWLIYASDMYKIKHKNPEQYSPEKTQYDGIHFPSVGVVFTHKANRFSLAYVKQVEGINCAGGICRLEPTFHGVRLQASSAF